MTAETKRGVCRGLAVVGLLFAGCAGMPWSSPPVFGPPTDMSPGNEFRYYPLIVDLDRDGHLDIVAAHRMPGSRNSLRIYDGDSTGRFEEREWTWRSPGYAGLAAGDLNGDGHLDLVAASHFHRVVSLLSDGAGGFRSQALSTEDGWVGAELADLDGDGHLDLVLLGWKEAGIQIWRGDGTGGWTSTQSLLDGIGRVLELVDLDGDGKQDIVASLGNHGIVVLWQREGGEWEQQDMGFPSRIREFRSMALADVNRDGRLDFVLNGGFDGDGVPQGPDVYLADGTGGYTKASEGMKVMGVATESVAVGDVDGDGHLDVVAGGSLTLQVGPGHQGLFLFRGNGLGQWKLDRNSGLPSTGLIRPYASVLEDLDGDGDADLVVTHGTTQGGPGGSVSVWLNQ